MKKRFSRYSHYPTPRFDSHRSGGGFVTNIGLYLPRNGVFKVQVLTNQKGAPPPEGRRSPCSFRIINNINIFFHRVTQNYKGLYMKNIFIFCAY